MSMEWNPEDASDAEEFLKSSTMACEPFPLDSYEIETKALGLGSAATVYHGRHRSGSRGDHPSDIVLKILKSKELKRQVTDELALLCKEVEVLVRVQHHPNIIGFYGVCLWDNACEESSSPSWAMQMEYCRSGDLHDAVLRKRFHEAEAHVLMIQILEGLAHVHQCGYVHRDVKPENILLTDDGVAKLADFGIAARLSDDVSMSKRCGSPGYVAPEVLLRKDYGIKIDSFSAGALLYFAISGKAAFGGSTIESVMSKTITQPVNFRKAVSLERLSEGCKAFITSLLQKDPSDRPTASEALTMMAWSSDAAYEDNDELVISPPASPCSPCTGKADRWETSEKYFDERLSGVSTTYRESTDRYASTLQDGSRDTSFRASFHRDNSKYCSSKSHQDDDSVSKIEDVCILSEYEPRRPTKGAPSADSTNLRRSRFTRPIR